MSYENPVYVTYSIPANNYGSGDAVKDIRPPRGARAGRVESIGLYATTTFNQVTTQAFVRVGVASDTDKFAELPIGALAAGAALVDSDVVGVFTNDGQFDLAQESEDEVRISLIAPTGGTPAGVADTFVTVAWYY